MQSRSVPHPPRTKPDPPGPRPGRPAPPCWTSAGTRPMYGGQPVRISQRIAPRAKTSTRVSTSRDISPRLLRRHVGWRADDRPGAREIRACRAAPRRGHHGLVRPRWLVQRPVLLATGQDLGQAPVHHLHLAEAAHHDVRRLQVAVDHPPRWAYAIVRQTCSKMERNRGRSSAGVLRAASSAASVRPLTSFMVKYGRRSGRVPSR